MGNLALYRQDVIRPALERIDWLLWLDEVGGNLFKNEWLTDWSDIPELRWRAIYADTAQKVGQKNDYSVFQVWGAGVDGKAYLLDQARGKWEAPELRAVAIQIWRKHQADNGVRLGHLRSMKIEDTVSGTGLIQSLGRDGVPVEPIERGGDKDKYTRALDAIPSFATGLVRLPSRDVAPWRGDYDRELLSFTGRGDTHDDQVDPTVDAVKDICGGPLPYAAWV